ncbi:hypothetical protein LXL04_026439 [Taraxacum kok-saghyz]
MHARFISSSRDNILDLINVNYPKVGPLKFTHHNEHAFEVAQLFKSIASNHDDSSYLSKEYYSGLLHSSRLKTGYRLLGRQCHGYLLKSGLVLHQYVKATLARYGDLNLGRQVHKKLLMSDVTYDESVCNAIMKMYGKCKEISSARKVFDTCEPPPNVTLWTTFLAAYLENGSFKKSLLGFIDMQRSDVVPNESIFCILLTAIAELLSLSSGNMLHALIVKTGFKDCKKVKDTLINMYSRTGDIKAAKNVFLGMSIYNRDVITWNMMIRSYNLHGYGNRSLRLFRDMLELREVDVNDETFVGVQGQQGFNYFHELMKEKGIKPSLEHHMCIINMLIKAGELNEALSFILSTPSKSDVFAWSSLIIICHDHGNHALGIRGTELIPDDVASKVSKWFGVTQVRELMGKKEIGKWGDLSWVVVNNKTFIYDSVHKGDPGFDQIHKGMQLFLNCHRYFTDRYDPAVQGIFKKDREVYHRCRERFVLIATLL